MSADIINQQNISASTEKSSSNNENALLTEEEAAIYDRQIRLWGLEAQSRLRNAKILVVGVTGLSAEIIKNIVLAGVHTLCVMDMRCVAANEIARNILFSNDSLGKNRAETVCGNIQELNSRVFVRDVKRLPRELSHLNANQNESQGDWSILDFDLVINCSSDAQCCVSSSELSTETNISDIFQEFNSICRANNIKHFCVGGFGKTGFAFVDLVIHEFVVCQSEETPASTSNNSEAAPSEYSKQCVEFKPLNSMAQLNWTALLAVKPRNRVSSLFFVQFALRLFEQQFHKIPSMTDLEQLRAVCKRVFQSHMEIDESKFESLFPEKLLEACCENSDNCCAINAIMAGVVSQEIIKAICANNAPFGNWLFFESDSLQMTAKFL